MSFFSRRTEEGVNLSASQNSSFSYLESVADLTRGDRRVYVIIEGLTVLPCPPPMTIVPRELHPRYTFKYCLHNYTTSTTRPKVLLYYTPVATYVIDISTIKRQRPDGIAFFQWLRSSCECLRGLLMSGRERPNGKLLRSIWKVPSTRTIGASSFAVRLHEAQILWSKENSINKIAYNSYLVMSSVMTWNL